jgi:5-methylcytosine-specific restriction protein A
MKKISESKAKTINEMAKLVYLGKKTIEDCFGDICKLYNTDDNNFSSFKNFFVPLFRDMMNGTEFKSPVPQILSKCFLENIYIDFGADGLRNALKTYKSTIEHLETKGNKKIGDKKIYNEYLSILNKSISEDKLKYTISNELDETEKLDIEGLRKSVFVNIYERSSSARKKCIQSKGTICAVCGFDFKKKYGELGEGFIHVHHIIPISLIDESYVINYETDLIPVCPNCHAMLHRGKNGEVLSVEELRCIIDNSKGNIDK